MSYPENCLVSLANTEQCATEPVFPTTLRIVDWDTVKLALACGACDVSGDPEWDGTLTADFTGIPPGDPPIYLATGVSLGGLDIEAQVYYGPPWVLIIICDGMVTDDIFSGLKGGDFATGTYNVNIFATHCSVLTAIELEAVSDDPTEVTECIDAGSLTTVVSGLTDEQRNIIQAWLDNQALADATYNALHAAAGYNKSGFPTGGVDISVDVQPTDSFIGAWTPFGRLTIREDVQTDFNVPGGTLILTIPENFIFRPGTGTISTTGTDISATLSSVSGNKITINLTVTATDTLDEIIIDGLEIQPNDGIIDYNFSYPADYLQRRSEDPGTAVIDNIAQDVTIFSRLNLIAGQAAQLTVATQPVGAPANNPFATQPIIQILDQFGNINTTDNITVVSAARLHGVGTLGGTTDVQAVNGVVTFTDLQHDTVEPIDIRFFVRGLSNYVHGVISDFVDVT